MTIHPIEAESYRILQQRIDLSHLAPGPRAVIERVIHASADLEFATTMVVDEASVDAGVRAVRAGAVVVADVEMVRAAITGPSVCLLGSVNGGTPTRSAQAIREAASRYPKGALWVVGCAPTALSELMSLVEAGAVEPALVIGLPVGFVGAAESKSLVREVAARMGLPAVTNVGEKGGSAVAGAAFNALVRLAKT